ncbi:MAG: hypothetical protein ACRDPE_04580 [Solirubrobacterales bacterium]
MNSPTMDEIAPPVTNPVCCGCGNNVDPTFAKLTTDGRLVCNLCAPHHSLRKPAETGN